jgi:hypothetical protein
MEFLIWIIFTVLTIIPLRKLLPHFGVTPNWAFTSVIPIAPLVLIWIMAAKLQEMEKR